MENSLNKYNVSDEEVEEYIRTATRIYDEEKNFNTEHKEEYTDADGIVHPKLPDFSGFLRETKIAKLSDYPNLTEKELGYFGLKNVQDYSDLKKQVKELLSKEKKERNRPKIEEEINKDLEFDKMVAELNQKNDKGIFAIEQNKKVQKLTEKLGKAFKENNQEKISKLQQELNQTISELNEKQFKREYKEYKKDQKQELKENLRPDLIKEQQKVIDEINKRIKSNLLETRSMETPEFKILKKELSRAIGKMDCYKKAIYDDNEINRIINESSLLYSDIVLKELYASNDEMIKRIDEEIARLEREEEFEKQQRSRQIDEKHKIVVKHTPAYICEGIIEEVEKSRLKAESKITINEYDVSKGVNIDLMMYNIIIDDYNDSEINYTVITNNSFDISNDRIKKITQKINEALVLSPILPDMLEEFEITYKEKE